MRLTRGSGLCRVPRWKVYREHRKGRRRTVYNKIYSLDFGIFFFLFSVFLLSLAMDTARSLCNVISFDTLLIRKLRYARYTVSLVCESSVRNARSLTRLSRAIFIISRADSSERAAGRGGRAEETLRSCLQIIIAVDQETVSPCVKRGKIPYVNSQLEKFHSSSP